MNNLNIYGKNPILLNVTYQRANKDKHLQECFKVIYKDDDGKVHYIEEEPIAEIWIVKEEYRDYDYFKYQEKMERMDVHRIPVSKIRAFIAAEAGPWGEAIVKKAKQEPNYMMKNQILNQLYKWPYAFRCDFQPEWYYINDWYRQYPLTTIPMLSTAYMDIEIDMIDYMVDMEHVETSAYAPVNVVSLILDETHEAFQFMLEPYLPSNIGIGPKDYEIRLKKFEKQCKDFYDLKDNVDGYIQELKDRFNPTYGELDYKVRFYKNEIELIADIFRVINNRKPNFLECWNMRFDIDYLYNRIKVLGYDPNTIIPSPEIPNPYCRFKKDDTTYLIEKQFDYFYCSSFTIYICQMRLYGSIRKSQHKLRSLSLNAIGDRELGDKKVEYADETNIIDFPYKDWRKFSIYNMKDTLLQKGIENRTHDVLTYFLRSAQNLCPYNKLFKETHLLRYARELDFNKQGQVQGNNPHIAEVEDESANLFYGVTKKDEESKKLSFKGAINAEPVWNSNIGERVLGVVSNNMFKNPQDYDMGAFYPSIKIICNLDPMTLLCKASFYNNEFISGEFSNKSLNQQYEEVDKNNKIRPVDITGEAVNTYMSKNILTFGYNYLNLPSITDLNREVCNILGVEE